jgi:hypothetical protein
MKSLAISTIIVFLLTSKIITAQSLEGNWKGTSLCQIKSSPCHDETVIYHISKGKGNNSYTVNASKIIDGKEDEMGVLYFTYDPKQSIFYLNDTDRQVKWEFKLNDNKMHGTLTSKGKLFRVVELKKEG